MTLVAEVHVISATKNSLGAAKVALPVDKLVAMLCAVELTASNLLDCTFFADHVFLSGRLSHIQVSFAVHQSSKIG